MLLHPATSKTAAEQDDELLRRVWLFSALAYAVGAIAFLSRNEWKSLLGFSCSAGVIMINFAWLEGTVTLFLQPTSRLKSWRLALRPLARFVLFGVTLSIAILVARFDALSVLLGFSVLVAGILIEAVYSAIQSFRT